MAVIQTVTSLKGTLKLDAGTTASGTVRTVNVSMGTMSKEGYDADKWMAVVARMSNVLDKSVFRIVKTEETDLEDE